MAIKLSHHVARGLRNITGKDVACPKTGQTDAVGLIVNRDCGRIHADSVNADVVGQQDPLYFVVACVAAQFAAVTNNKDDAAAGLVAFTHVLGRF